MRGALRTFETVVVWQLYAMIAEKHESIEQLNTLDGLWPEAPLSDSVSKMISW